MFYTEAKDFDVVELGEAKPGSLFFAAHPEGYMSLITLTDPALEVILTGDWKWRAERLDNLQEMWGVAIPGVRIELDLHSLAGEADNVTGTISRHGEHLLLAALQPSGRMRLDVRLESGLDDIKHQRAIFQSWRIVKGEGDELVVLWQSEKRKE